MMQTPIPPKKIYRVDELGYVFNRVKKNTVLILDTVKKGGKQDLERIEYCITYFKDLYKKIDDRIINPFSFLSSKVFKVRSPPAVDYDEDIKDMLKSIKYLIDQLERILNGDTSIDVSEIIKNLVFIVDNIF